MSVFLIDFHSQIHGNAIVLKKHHGLAHFFFCFHLFANGHGHFFTDAFYLRKAFRLFFHNPEGVCLKLFYNSGSKSSSHAFYGAGAQIPFNRRIVFRRFNLITFYLKLFSVHRMLNHGARRFHHLAFTDVVKGSYQNGLVFSIGKT